MSSQKQKTKEKKSQAQIDLQNRFNDLRVELLQKEIRVKRLEQQKSRMGLDLFATIKENEQLKKYISLECDKLNINIKGLKDRITELNDKKNQLEIQVATATAKLQFQRKEHQQDKKERDKEFEDYKRHYLAQLSRLEIQAAEYSSAISQRQGILNEKSNLLKVLQQQRQNSKRQLADKDREKIQALDSLKKQMMDKIRSMKSNLLLIRRDQLQNNTRLTFLQNHQLLQELQYQSLNTQNIIDRNIEMQKQLKNLQNQVQIRQQVQKQIAKRALFSKKMLQTVHQKCIQLQKQKSEAQQHKNAQNQNKQDVNALQNKVSQLIKTIQSAMRKIQSLQKHLSLKNSQVQEYKKIIKREAKQNDKMAALFNRYLKDCLEGKCEIENANQIDFQKLKRKNIQEWASSQVKFIVQAMLNNFKNSIIPSHLNADLWRTNADKKVLKLCPINQSKLVKEQMTDNIKCNSEYIRSLSLQKNRMFYRGRAQAQEKTRSLTKMVSDKSMSFGKYVQANVRGWGKEVTQKEKPSQKSLAQRFMKPLKFRLR